MSSDQIIVTIHFDGDIVDLELPKHVPFGDLMHQAGHALNWFPTTSPDATEFVARIPNANQLIRNDDHLADVSLIDGDIILAHKAEAPIITTSSNHDPNDYDLPAYPLLFAHETAQVFPLKGDKINIGRTKENTISLERFRSGDRSSRLHAFILHEEGLFYIEDNESTNGTLVAGYPLGPNERILLFSNTKIQFGKAGPLFTFFAGT